MNFAIFLFALLLLNVNNCYGSNEELIQLHVLFRHGSRTPDEAPFYKTDPYENENYYPFEKGQLTREGILQSYRIGQDLRNCYNDFLGDIYTPDILHAVASHFSRSKATLEAVLAGLFSPDETQQFLPGLLWQPIPFEYKSEFNDNLLFILRCQNYMKELEGFVNRQNLTQHKDLFRFLTKHTGVPVKSSMIALALYHHLKTQQEMGLVLPSWTRKVFPNTLLKLTNKYYEDIYTDFNIQKIIPGNLLRYMIDESKQKIWNTNNRKIYLYSGHDHNLSSLLVVFGAYKGVPPYASYLILEVLQMDGVYGIKIKYQDYTKSEPYPIILKNCDEFCPLDKFEYLLKDIIPDKISYCKQPNTST